VYNRIPPGLLVLRAVTPSIIDASERSPGNGCEVEMDACRPGASLDVAVVVVYGKGRPGCACT